MSIHTEIDGNTFIIDEGEAAHTQLRNAISNIRHNSENLIANMYHKSEHCYAKWLNGDVKALQELVILSQQAHFIADKIQFNTTRALGQGGFPLIA